jgi:hypothetical protein
MSGRRGRGGGRGGRGGRGSLSGARALLQRSVMEAGLDTGNLRSLQQDPPTMFRDYEWHSNGSIILKHESNKEKDNAVALASTTTNKPSTTNIALINKSRELQQRFQTSVFYLHPSVEVDVERYSPSAVGNKRHKKVNQDDVTVQSFLQQLGPTLTNSRYLPAELLKQDQRTLGTENLSLGETTMNKRRLSSLQELEDVEGQQQPTRDESASLPNATAATGNTTTSQDDGNASDNMGEDGEHLLEEEEEEDAADYTTNYYASEDDSNDGGGGDDDEDEAVF